MESKEEYEVELEGSLAFDTQQAEVLKAISDTTRPVDTLDRDYRHQRTTANQLAIGPVEAQVTPARDAFEDAIENFKEDEHKEEGKKPC